MPEFGDWATRDVLPRGFRNGEVVDLERPIEVTPFYVWEVGGYEFVPLVTWAHGLACELHVGWFRREDPSSITSGGGDLDNRLKSLIEAARHGQPQPSIGASSRVRFPPSAQVLARFVGQPGFAKSLFKGLMTSATQRSSWPTSSLTGVRIIRSMPSS